MSTGGKGVRPKRRTVRLVHVELDGEIVIYDEEDDSVHHLNPTASLVWKLCDGTATVKELASEFAKVFEIPESDMEKDLRKIIRQMANSKLMDAPKASPRATREERP